MKAKITVEIRLHGSNSLLGRQSFTNIKDAYKVFDLSPVRQDVNVIMRRVTDLHETIIDSK